MPLNPKYAKILKEMQSKYGAKKGTQVFNAWTNKENLETEAKAYYFTSEQFKAFNDEFVEGAFAVGTPDTYNDILTEHCLDDMVEQLKSLPLTLDDNHESFKNVPVGQRVRQINPIAKFENPKRDGIRINVKAVLNQAHRRYEEIKSSIKNGFLHSFSFGYIATDFEYKSIDGVRHRVINALRLINGCFTGVPIQSDSMFRTVALKSLADCEVDDEEIKSLIGGIDMSDDKNAEATAEAKAAELKATEAKKAEELKAEQVKVDEAKSAEIKALTNEVKSQRKEMAELKAAIEKKAGDKADTDKDGDKDGKDDKGTVEERMATLEQKALATDKILSKAQIKGLMTDKGAQASGAETKGNTGPLDLIQ